MMLFFSIKNMNSTTTSRIFIGIVTLIAGVLVANTLFTNHEVSRKIQKLEDVKTDTTTGNTWFETRFIVNAFKSLSIQENVFLWSEGMDNKALRTQLTWSASTTQQSRLALRIAKIFL